MQGTICTKENPNTNAKVHPDSIVVYEEYGGLSGGGDYERYECPNCKRRFWVELPD